MAWCDMVRQAKISHGKTCYDWWQICDNLGLFWIKLTGFADKVLACYFFNQIAFHLGIGTFHSVVIHNSFLVCGRFSQKPNETAVTDQRISTEVAENMKQKLLKSIPSHQFEKIENKQTPENCILQKFNFTNHLN